jgi:chromosome segregation protein
MYLKSIEIHGFKSFATKTKFEFDNGITGIVGPNGSGKSNVADAVRWVLGEQRAKQLRGASMQDIIFAGTQNRKPLGYAYVAITMDNADHALPIDYGEVTVARRIYRSGESEYLLNGTTCRLKDVQELFYDTGIGKEGYSIIGQGQIEKIISGKPEERRELFDEAAGIVKFKRRKATTEKKLSNEENNLVRVNDIIFELEKQIGPLEKQSEKARAYLKKREELKGYDINMFLYEIDRLNVQLEKLAADQKIVADDAAQTNRTYEQLKEQSKAIEEEIASLDETIEKKREQLSQNTLEQNRLEGQVNVLKEQIHAAQISEEHYNERMEKIAVDLEEKQTQKETYGQQRQQAQEALLLATQEKTDAQEALDAIASEEKEKRKLLEKGKSELLELLNSRANIQSQQQRFQTMLEQTNIKKAQLSQQLIHNKSEVDTLTQQLVSLEEERDQVETVMNEKRAVKQENAKKLEQMAKTLKQKSVQLEQTNTQLVKEQSRLEALHNMSERYEGYGNSIRRVMEKKSKEPHILGVVADLIRTSKEYEMAIETALGGTIQNIVTEDEQCAKRMIAYLKENRYGRATFLPLTSVDGRTGFSYPDALKEEGVVGTADKLVQTDPRYEKIAVSLLGRTLVADTIDHALAIARKYRQKLRIVTLEGELLQPGGALTGGAFKNSSNLLGRRREMEQLDDGIKKLSAQRKRLTEEVTGLRQTRDTLRAQNAVLTEEISRHGIEHNTANLCYEQAKEQVENWKRQAGEIHTQHKKLEEEMASIQREQEVTVKQQQSNKEQQEQIEQHSTQLEEEIASLAKREEDANHRLSEAVLKEASVQQKAEFVQQNFDRVTLEIEQLKAEKESLSDSQDASADEAAEKFAQIDEIQKTAQQLKSDYTKGMQMLEQTQQRREEQNAQYKSFFDQREALTIRLGNLEKEQYRLDAANEKAQEEYERQNNYIWQEYELTYHNALPMKNEQYDQPAESKKRIRELKDEMKKLGDVNMNAIEDYKNVSERYTFLTEQRDDLEKAKQMLLSIIAELDEGMRRQFNEQFAQIQSEFDKAFKELFGGGKGNLELVEGEDILECGISIIAQPPGKKLQNMMQLSGGEKSLTAIALLFAIQNLKPSPFCLLDEIEAALDEPNVDRFAGYLHKLTKHTQFIIITHRRGTMSVADRLYGITMQEKGVSAQVSVNLVEEELEKEEMRA